ncbi:nitrilase-related carbon-nitrogen hydrolase [Chloroflexota bacterium]
MDSIDRKNLAFYEAVELTYKDIGACAVQMNPMPVNSKQPKKGIKANLEHMLFLCDAASASVLRKPNLLVFPEFTLTGWDLVWTLKDWLNVAIEVPGEETEAIGKKARQCNYYIVFACHTKDRDWPGHYFNTSIIIDPSGEVIHKHWKAYSGGPGGEWGTTVHDVLDEFINRYGWDAVWPVASTQIGNIATYVCSEGFVPETARAFAFKGAEILCRCIGGGGGENKGGRFPLQFRADCAASNVYGVYSNGGSGATFNGVRVENGAGGSSMIVDPFGRIMNQATDSREAIIYDTIPIASFRDQRDRPFIRTELYAPVLEQYPGKYPPNMYSKYRVPNDWKDATKLAREHARWDDSHRYPSKALDT